MTAHPKNKDLEILVKTEHCKHATPEKVVKHAYTCESQNYCALQVHIGEEVYCNAGAYVGNKKTKHYQRR